MTIETTTTLRCDAKECRASITVIGDLADAWEAATAKRWVYGTDVNGSHDWCPWHTDPERRIS